MRLGYLICKARGSRGLDIISYYSCGHDLVVVFQFDDEKYIIDIANYDQLICFFRV